MRFNEVNIIWKHDYKVTLLSLLSIGIFLSTLELSAAQSRAKYKGKSKNSFISKSEKKVTQQSGTKKTYLASKNPINSQAVSNRSSAGAPSEIAVEQRMPQSTMASSVGADSGKSIEVRGQARSLSMMLVLKNKKDDINFVKPRENYRKESRETEY